jgi:hypothetical protein
MSKVRIGDMTEIDALHARDAARLVPPPIVSWRFVIHCDPGAVDDIRARFHLALNRVPRSRYCENAIPRKAPQGLTVWRPTSARRRRSASWFPDTQVTES